MDKMCECAAARRRTPAVAHRWRARVRSFRRKTDLEKNIDEALEPVNWGAASSLLQRIAESTYD